MQPSVATNTNGDCCTAIGNTPLPQNKVTSWNIKMLSLKNDGMDIYIGAAPSDIDQNEGNYKKCGWYFNCYWSTLWSGPPCYYRWKEYGPKKKMENMFTQETVWGL